MNVDGRKPLVKWNCKMPLPNSSRAWLTLRHFAVRLEMALGHGLKVVDTGLGPKALLHFYFTDMTAFKPLPLLPYVMPSL